MWGSVIVNSTGPTISGHQILVLEEVAAAYLRSYRGAARIEFKHPLCKGVAKYKKEGRLGTFSGAVFEAYIINDNGKTIECEFILADGREHVGPDDMPYAITFRPLGDGQYSGEYLDPNQARGVEVSKITSN
ncbi:MAG: hypothetical protein G01um101456_145 [Parcubacteria group bacterium Gr01-1014_56]|nr:MAG: hypothetical protein G01um101456_145 [Parcubacteria group bacterium Gr01-1014_56]